MPLNLEELGLGVYVDGFRQFMKQTGDMATGVAGLSKEIDKSAKPAEKWSKSLTKVGEVGMGVGATMTAGLTLPILGAAMGATQAAAEANRYRGALIGLAGGAEKAEGYIKAIQTASQGAITSTDAMSYATRGLTLGVVQNADQMQRLTGIAITLGRAQGLTAAQSVNDLTVALGRQSPMILDNLGITMKLSEAYKKYAERLGKTEKELTEQEKRQAFVVEALEKGASVAERLGGVQQDLGSQTQTLQNQMQDLRVEIGNELLPIMMSLMGTAKDLVGGFADLDDATRQWIIRLGIGGAAAGPAVTGLFSLVNAAGKLIALLPEISVGLGLAAEGLSVTSIATLGTGAAIGGLVLPITAVGAAMAGWFKVMGDVQERELELVDTHMRAAIEYQGFSTLYQIEQEKIQAASALSAGQMADYAAMAEHTGLKLGMVGDKTLEMVDKSKFWIASGNEFKTNLEETGEAAEGTAEALDKVGKSGDQMASAFEKEVDWSDWRKQAWEHAKGLGLNVAQLAVMADQLGIAGQAHIKASLRAQGYANQLQTGEITLDEYLTKMSQLGREVDMTDPILRDQNEALREQQTRHQETLTAVENAGAGMRDYQDRAEEAITATDEMTTSVMNLRGETEESYQPIVDFGHALSGSGVAQRAEEAKDQILLMHEAETLLTESLLLANFRMHLHYLRFINIRDQAQIAAGAIRAVHNHLLRLPKVRTVVIQVKTVKVGASAPIINDPGAPGYEEGYQHGTDFVPRTGIYLLHRGEAVLPVHEARSYRTVTHHNQYNYNLTTQSTTRAGALRHEFEAMEALGTR